MMTDDFALIGALTFFICEAIFNIFPVEQARMKQLTAMLVGAALGFLLLHGTPIDNIIQGLLAGGAATVTVAKFKKPSASVMVESGATVNVSPATPVTMTPVVGPMVMPEPVEHL